MENESRPITPPIAAPTGEVSPLPATPDAPLNYRDIANWHRWMLWTWLFTCFTDVAFISTQIEDIDQAEPMAIVLYIGSILLSLAAFVLRCVTVFRLSKSLRDFGPWIGAVLSVWGLIGFFIMLSLNKRARRKLRAAGIRVGFWGADLKNIPA